MPNYGQYGENSTWKSRFDYRQTNTIIRNFEKSDGYCKVNVVSPLLVSTNNVEVHIFNPSIKTIGVKQLVCHPTQPIVQGSVITYLDSKKYISVDIDTHQSIQNFGRIYLMNTLLKWIDDEGNLQIEYGVDNESLGQQDTARQVVQTDGRKNIWVQNNVNTRKLAKNFRFIFGGIEAYKITFIDNWSKEGLIMFRLEVTQILDNDDLVNNIAYNGESTYTPQPSNDIQFSVNELQIIQNYSASVTVSEVGQPLTTFTFSIIGLPVSSYEIVSSTSNSIEIKCKEVYYEGLLRATSDITPTQYAEIPIKLVGLF